MNTNNMTLSVQQKFTVDPYFNIQCVHTVDLFRFRGASVLGKGVYSLLVSDLAVFVVINAQPEMQSIDSWQVLSCSFGTAYVFYITPQGYSTPLGSNFCDPQKGLCMVSVASFPGRSHLQSLIALQ